MTHAALQTPTSVPLIRMEEQRAKQLLDEVMDEFISKDSKVFDCVIEAVEKIINQCSKHYDELKTIKGDFFAQLEKISEERCRRAETLVHMSSSQLKQYHPKILYVVSMSCTLGPNFTPEMAKEVFKKQMSSDINGSYGYLVASDNMCLGRIGYTNEPLAMPVDTAFLCNSCEVQCTHDFVDELKRQWRQRTSPGQRNLYYKNLKTRMTNKSCYNHCLKNVNDKPVDMLNDIKQEEVDVENDEEDQMN